MRFPSWPAAVHLSLAATLLAAAPAHPQRGGDGFLFRPPAGSVTLHGGFAGATAGSDLFSDVTEMLTLDRGDFGAWSGGGVLSITLRPRLDLALSASYAGRTRSSEFRDWTEHTEQGELAIEQATTFLRVPVMASAKAYLTPRGRTIGSFGWVPARTSAYVGAGAGAVWYRFRQEGDFVDLDTLDIFWDEIESSGWAPAAQAFGGLDYSLTPRVVLVGEARYLYGRADLDRRSFQGFDPIDLSGVAGSIGISFRF
jgi:opacity protein-like surface antigen